MTEGERKELTEYSCEIEDALCRIEKRAKEGIWTEERFVLRLILRTLRILLVDKLR